MDIPRVLPEEIEYYIKANSKAGQKILAGLMGIYPEISAVFGTEVGQEILKEDIKRLDELFPLMYNENATDLQKAEFRFLRDIRLPKILGKLATYLQKVQVIKGGVR